METFAVDTIGCVVGASAHATWAAAYIHAHITRCGSLLNHLLSGFLIPFGESVHIDIPVRAVLGAQPTTNTVVFDFDL